MKNLKRKSIVIFLILAIFSLVFFFYNNTTQATTEQDPDGCKTYNCFGGPSRCAWISVGVNQWATCHQYPDIIVEG